MWGNNDAQELWGNLSNITDGLSSAFDELDSDITSQLQAEYQEAESKKELPVRRSAPTLPDTSNAGSYSPSEATQGGSSPSPHSKAQSKQPPRRAPNKTASEKHVAPPPQQCNTTEVSREPALSNVDPAAPSTQVQQLEMHGSADNDPDTKAEREALPEGPSPQIPTPENDEGEWSVVGSGGPTDSVLVGADHSQQVLALEGELEAVRYTLAEKHEELTAATEALNNLQNVLEDFQDAREAERNHLAMELRSARDRADEAKELKNEVQLWKERYTESEEAGAKVQIDAETQRRELLRLSSVEEFLAKERSESRRLAFELQELEMSTKRKGKDEEIVAVAVAQQNEIREQGTDGPQSRQGVWRYFGILLEPGPYGVPHGLTIYFIFLHFIGWWAHRSCF